MICFMFGHANCPEDSLDKIVLTAERHYAQHGVRDFYVGNRGNFDRLAAVALKQLKRKHEDIRLFLLLAYHPGERKPDITEGFDGSYYPLMNDVPKRIAIVRANRYMTAQADTIICYVNHVGNTRELLEYAKKQKTKQIIDNIAQGEE